MTLAEHGIPFIFNFYQTSRADFTASKSGFGMVTDRINTFNAQLNQVCSPDGDLGRNFQVICVDTQSIFDGMDTS